MAKGFKPGKGSKQAVATVRPSGSPTNVPAGGPGKSFPQKPFAGPAKTGLPSAMRKALRK